MKVLLISKWVAGATKGDFYYPGQWRDTYELGLALKQKGINVHLLTAQVYPRHKERFWQEFGQHLKRKGIEHHFAKTYLAFGSEWGLFRWKFFLKELSLVYQVKPDIIQYMEFGSSLLFPFVGSRPIINYSCHLFDLQQKAIDFKIKKQDWSLTARNYFSQAVFLGFNLLYLGFSWLFGARGIDQLVKRGAILVFMHKRGYQKAKKHFGNRTQVIYIPKGVDLRDAQKTKIKKVRSSLAQKTILYLGRIYFSRGVFDLLEAFKIVNQKTSANLLIAGTGPKSLVKKLKNKIRPLGKSVSYLGSVDYQKKWQLFYQSAVFCLPSYHDAYPGAMLEAMASGLAVVTTFEIDSPIKNGKNGLKIHSGDINELAAVLIKFLNSPRKRRLMAKNAYQTALNFSWDKTAQQFVDFYKKILR